MFSSQNFFMETNYSNTLSLIIEHSLKNSNIIISGAGLTGLALALCLAKLKISSVILERRSSEDLARYEYISGREIGLDISKRGQNTLDHLNLLQKVVDNSMPMYYRVFHEMDSSTVILNYGYTKEDNILSISRSRLHEILLEDINKNSYCTLHTEVEVIHFNSLTRTLRIHNFQTKRDQEIKTIKPVIACDGVFSVLRSNLEKDQLLSVQVEPLPQLYKSFKISHCTDLDPQGMHVWARGAFAFVAQPIAKDRFAAALLLNGKGTISFDSLKNHEQITCFFEAYFPDIKSLIPDWLEQYQASKCGELYSVYLNKWYVPPSLLFMGDAAHGMAPFFGQGVNSGFEDAIIFSKIVEEFYLINDVHSALENAMIQFDQKRLPDGHAITRMSRENYPELVEPDKIHTLYLRKKLERFLAESFPNHYLLAHNLVCFGLVPYHTIETIKKETDEVVNKLLETGSSVDGVDLVYAQQLIEQYCKTLPYVL